MRIQRVIFLMLMLMLLNAHCAAEPTGWDPERAFEIDPCLWTLAGISQFGERTKGLETLLPSAEDMVTALKVDGQLERFTKSVDDMANHYLGIRWSRNPIVVVRNRDLPFFDFSPQLEITQEAASSITPRYREGFKRMVDSPEVPAFLGLFEALVNQRLAELRYAEESVNPEAQALFEGSPVSKVHIVGGLGAFHQFVTSSTFLLERNPGEPVVSLVDYYTSMAHTPLQKMVSIIRSDLEREYVPQARNSQLNFNTEYFRYTGMFEAEDRWSCRDNDDLLAAIESALSFPEREEVTIEVPVENQYVWGPASQVRSIGGQAVQRSSLAYVLGFQAVTHQGFQPTHEASQQAIRDVLVHVAMGMTRQTRVFTATENRPKDIMEILKVTSPPGTFSANYSVVFRRRDDKRIRIRFTGPTDLSHYAQPLMSEAG